MQKIRFSTGMRWTGVSVVGREGIRMVFTIALARLVGPEAFGIVAQAVVYMTIVALFLDQGFSSALIQRPQLEPRLPGTIVSVNLAVGLVLMALTLGIAPAWSEFMDTPELTLVLMLFAPSLLIRSACVTPRALLLRRMEFRTIAIVDIVSAFVGGGLGVLAALSGAGYWAIVVQLVTTDLVLLCALLLLSLVPRPAFDIGALQSVAGFSTRAFASGSITMASQNLDKLLVGKFQGPDALAFYGLGYRLLLLPIQLLSVTVGSVLFPAFSRLAGDLDAVRYEMTRATRALALVSLPSMLIASAAAPEIVPLLFGLDWEPAIPIVQVLAIAGALQSIYQPSTVPLVLGLGHPKLILRLSIVANSFLVVGVVVGLQISTLAVAIGYTAATAAFLPLEWVVRRHLLGLTVIGQIRQLIPGLNVAIWMAASYAAVAHAVAVRSERSGLALTLGLGAASLVGIGILRALHRDRLDELLYMARRILARPSTESAAETKPNAR